MLYRLGSALLLIGLISLVVFLVTFQAGQGERATLIAGISFCAIGLLFWRRARRSQIRPPSRFHTIRRILGRFPPGEE
ncbi:MAG: hypothetical protein IIC78_09220 [Chloroflexi bacterium]|nr:hypothetical protein [Chloroflexota bacterium]